MNFLLFSGPGGSGKTPSIQRFKDYLTKDRGYIEHETNLRGTDFDCLLLKENRKIIVCSDTDLISCIERLVELIHRNPDADSVVTSCKSFDVWPRQEEFKLLNLNESSNKYFEIPMGRQVTGDGRYKSLGWYLNSILEVAKIIGNCAPFNF